MLTSVTLTSATPLRAMALHALVPLVRKLPEATFPAAVMPCCCFIYPLWHDVLISCCRRCTLLCYSIYLPISPLFTHVFGPADPTCVCSPMVDVDSPEYRSYLTSTGHSLAKMTITTDSTTADVYVELHTSIVPSTCATFLASLTGGKYDNVPFDRVVPGGWVSTGSAEPDIDSFPDESFGVTFDSAYTIALCNEGPHTNKTKV